MYRGGPIRTLCVGVFICFVALAAGCPGRGGGGGGGDDDDDDNDDSAPRSATLTVTRSPSGDGSLSVGDCVSFTIDGVSTNFDATTAVSLGFNDSAVVQAIPPAPSGNPALVVAQSPTQITVGTAGNSPLGCWCVGPGAFRECAGPSLPGGPIEVVVEETGLPPLVIQDSLTLTAATLLPLPPDSPTAGLIAGPGEPVYYQSAGLTTGVWTTHTTTTQGNWVPASLIYGDESGLLGLGHRVTMREVKSISAFDLQPTVSDLSGGGGTGFDYSITLTELTTTDLTQTPLASWDTWDDPANAGQPNPGLFELNMGGAGTVGTYRGTLTGASDDYDPNPTADPADSGTWGIGCVAQTEGVLGSNPAFPVLGRGADVVFRYTVASDADPRTVLVGLQSDPGATAGSADRTLYVVFDPANSLPSGADGFCLAGADLFADGGTDSLIFNAQAGVTNYIVVDSFGPAPDAGEFLLYVDDTL